MSEDSYVLICLFAAVVFFGVGLALRYRRVLTLRDSAPVLAVELLPVRAASALPAGSLTAVEGILRCEAPLTSRLTKQACAFYLARADDSWTESTRDTDGLEVSRTERVNVFHHKHDVAFMVEDASGTIRVDPEKATVKARRVLRETGPGDPVPFHATTREVTEHTLAVDAPVYVLGARLRGGGIGSPPARKQQPFEIDYRTKSERLSENRRHAQWLQIAAVSCFALAAVCLLRFLVSMVSAR